MILGDLLNRILDALSHVHCVNSVLLINKHIAGKMQINTQHMNAFQEELEFKGDAEPQVQGVCLREFSCRSGKLSEGSKSGRRLSGGKGVDTFNRLGQLLSHIFSMKE